MSEAEKIARLKVLLRSLLDEVTAFADSPPADAAARRRYGDTAAALLRTLTTSVPDASGSAHVAAAGGGAGDVERLRLALLESVRHAFVCGDTP